MAYACFYDSPGDERIYAKVKAEIGEHQPHGLVAQLVSKLETGGLRHIAVWESREQWERFEAERVAPAVGKVLAGMGVIEPPPCLAVTEIDLVDVITKA